MGKRKTSNKPSSPATPATTTPEAEGGIITGDGAGMPLPDADEAKVSDPATSTVVEKPGKQAKDGEYVIAIGSMIVGKGEKRERGSIVKASEIPAAQLEYFIADGTLRAKG